MCIQLTHWWPLPTTPEAPTNQPGEAVHSRGVTVQHDAGRQDNLTAGADAAGRRFPRECHASHLWGPVCCRGGLVEDGPYADRRTSRRLDRAS
jgi:hypothetical protein